MWALLYSAFAGPLSSSRVQRVQKHDLAEFYAWPFISVASLVRAHCYSRTTHRHRPIRHNNQRRREGDYCCTHFVKMSPNFPIFSVFPNGDDILFNYRPRPYLATFSSTIPTTRTPIINQLKTMPAAFRTTPLSNTQWQPQPANRTTGNYTFKLPPSALVSCRSYRICLWPYNMRSNEVPAL